jgi:hypothetical protein
MRTHALPRGTRRPSASGPLHAGHSPEVAPPKPHAPQAPLGARAPRACWVSARSPPGPTRAVRRPLSWAPRASDPPRSSPCFAEKVRSHYKRAPRCIFTRASALPSPSSAAGAIAAPWSSFPSARVRRRTTTLGSSRSYWSSSHHTLPRGTPPSCSVVRAHRWPLCPKASTQIEPGWAPSPPPHLPRPRASPARRNSGRPRRPCP